ncbi:MAG: hypothetical protein R6V84_11165, partial [Desulfobacterales bacterium]
TDRADFTVEEVVLVGSGRNPGQSSGVDIVNYRWWVDDDQGQTWNERTWKFPPRGLIEGWGNDGWEGIEPGWHTFNFQVQNKAGLWSQAKQTRIWIVEKFTYLYLPTITR